jgi:YHS domain-containing protein
MKHLVLLSAVLILAAGCGRQTSQQSAGAQEMRTIESSDPRPAVLDPPPVLGDEAALPKPKNPGSPDAPAPLTEKDEEARAQLPFAPAIAMDPVDGSKISIRADTPRVELKNRFYYFSNEEHRRAFMANPDEYLKGAFSKL